MGIILLVLSALWGFAEATLFFIVPDVLLTFVVIWSFPYGLLGCLFALIGALAGGLVMYNFGKRQPDKALRVLGKIPAISETMIASAGTKLSQHGTTAMIRSVFRGVPYKIFAVQASRYGISRRRFLLASFPARIMRFLIAVLAMGLFAHVLFPAVTLEVKMAVCGLLWIGFYIFYFRRFKK